MMAVDLPWLVALVGISLRLAPLFFMAPLDPLASVPSMVKAMWVTVLGGVWLAFLPEPLQVSGSLNDIRILQLWASELLVGAVLALGAYAAAYAMSLAGGLVDMQSGLMSATIFNPRTSAQETPLSMVYYLAGVAWFYFSGAYVHILGAFFHSLEWVPLGSAWGMPSVAPVVKVFVAMFAAGVSIALPVVAVLLAIDFFAGLLSKSMPQLNVYFLFLPLKVFLALLLSALLLRYSSGMLGRMWGSAVEHMSAVGM